MVSSPLLGRLRVAEKADKPADSERAKTATAASVVDRANTCQTRVVLPVEVSTTRSYAKASFQARLHAPKPRTPVTVAVTGTAR